MRNGYPQMEGRFVRPLELIIAHDAIRGQGGLVRVVEAPFPIATDVI